jgi:hypothetical protein
MQLVPCEGCRRHVAVGSPSCPFCAARLGAPATARDPITRLSRAAVFVAAATAATTVGCWTSKTEPKHADPQQVQTATPDAGVADAAPVVKQLPEPDDDDRRNYQNHPCVDTPQGPMCAPYGAPPARRRVV